MGQLPLVALPLGGKTYRIRVDMRLICEIEDEIGSIPALRESLTGKNWRICDLVALVQTMLQSIGEKTDFRLLGQQILQEGVETFRQSALHFTSVALSGCGDASHPIN